jgi:hypothetical protein
MQDFLIGTVSGVISGVAAAGFVAWIAAGITTGVWSPWNQLGRVKGLVPKESISYRWKEWKGYVDEVTVKRPRTRDPNFHDLVKEIDLEFSSFPHPKVPPMARGERGMYPATLDMVPLLTRNDVVRGAIDKVRSRSSKIEDFPLRELLIQLYWLLN